MAHSAQQKSLLTVSGPAVGKEQMKFAQGPTRKCTLKDLQGTVGVNIAQHEWKLSHCSGQGWPFPLYEQNPESMPPQMALTLNKCWMS